MEEIDMLKDILREMVRGRGIDRDNYIYQNVSRREGRYRESRCEA